MNTASRQTLTPVISKPRRGRKRHHDESDIEISDALKKLENISTIIQAGTSQHVDDEFHHFAMNVAAQLRRLPLHVALNLQNDFQSKLSFARIHAAEVTNSRSSTQRNYSASYNDSDMKSGKTEDRFLNIQQRRGEFLDASQQSFFNGEQETEAFSGASHQTFVNDEEEAEQFPNDNQRSLLNLEQETSGLSDASQISLDSNLPLSTVIIQAWDNT